MEYKIHELSKKLDVPRSTVRYWESEFSDLIKPVRTPGGQRRYTDRDLKNFLKIKDLIRKKNQSIRQTKQMLSKGSGGKGPLDLDNQCILVTGGTGSFGKHFCRSILARYNPRVIRVYSRDELKQHEMRREFGEEKLRYFIGDVRDKERMRRAMEGVDIVVHAAALKQVPACEYNPLEAVKTNIIGAQNIIDAAIDAGVKKVMALSTDKAVNPVNLYGATKLCAEKIFIQGNSYTGERGTCFSCVRYGNVIGSRGSVIPLFLEQAKTGKVTVTDSRMTRFWITLDRAVELVVNGLTHMQGGEIFVPIIPSMKVMDLAKAVAPGCKVDFIGIRPGEKLHESMITEEDGRNTIAYKGMYVIMPALSWWEKGDYSSGQAVPEGFVYSSNTNAQWLTEKDLKKIIRDELSVPVCAPQDVVSAG
ncbi:UDP-N-acetylglucosamine 4,6-dehydratase (inverting) [Desulfatibacillum aliphaticivorans]|uniref:UDP-N-acetylglucosamine 4,6-dehydratase (inverting) n=1 Tax=Desulfatibacillum aliphaticivorans TaxID=218208 RepID=UPI00040604BD|nr:UDP-N-acetylglucosamine 4,6-dehydratase (inverting) [Desulfatibacillum aliphaticivorans]